MSPVNIQSPQSELFPIPASRADSLLIKSGLRFYLANVFAIPAPIVDRYFSYYKLLYWTGHHTIDSIEAGMIVRDNIAFYVRYHNDLTRGAILRNPTAQYALSFRNPKPGFGDPVVLVSISSPSSHK